MRGSLAGRTGGTIRERDGLDRGITADVPARAWADARPRARRHSALILRRRPDDGRRRHPGQGRRIGQKAKGYIAKPAYVAAASVIDALADGSLSQADIGVAEALRLTPGETGCPPADEGDE
jgi:hypothetical protein